MAERVLMKHLDAPGKWVQEKHRRLLMNKYCGRYLRDKHLHRFIIYSESVQEKYEHNRRLKNPITSAVQQAIHGLSYTVYGKPDVRRLMFEVFDFEQVQPKAVWSSGFSFPIIGHYFLACFNSYVVKRLKMLLRLFLSLFNWDQNLAWPWIVQKLQHNNLVGVSGSCKVRKLTTEIYVILSTVLDIILLLLLL